MESVRRLVDRGIRGSEEGGCGIILEGWVYDGRKVGLEPLTATSRCIPNDQSCLTLDGEEDSDVEEVVEKSPYLLANTSPAVVRVVV